ncbi:MAG: hypothetical protein RL367_1509 [Pseudomonadota bacterium]
MGDMAPRWSIGGVIMRVEVEGAIATVSLNRPERLNALTPEPFVDPAQCFDGLNDRLDVRVVISRGEDRGFCAGADFDSAAFAAPGPRTRAATDGDAMGRVERHCSDAHLSPTDHREALAALKEKRLLVYRDE